MFPFAGLFRWFRYDALKITPPRISALVLFILVVAVYVPFLNNPLIFDDYNIVSSPSFFDYIFQFSFAPRWLAYATLAHTHVMMDGSITAMRVGNLLIHAINVVLIFVLLRALCVATSSDSDFRRRDVRALVLASIGAALFAVHPVAVYGVGYLVQRTILMATLFMLLMLITYLRWLQTGRTALWVWSAICYFLSVFSKEHSIAAPAVALLLTLVLHRPSTALFRRLIVPFAAYAAIAMLAVLMVRGVLGSAYEPFALDMIKDAQDSGVDPSLAYPLSIVTQIYLYFKYVFLWMFPDVRWMSVDMREPLATSLLAWSYTGAIVGIACYVVVATAMLLRGGRVGLAGWLLLFPWIMFVTELSTVRVQEPFVLYRAYLWFPLFGALLPLALMQVRAKVAIALAIPVLCVWVALSWNRLHSLSDVLLTWEDAAKLLVTGKEPGAGRIYYNRALALSARNRHQEALADMDRAVSLNPRLAPVYFTRATVYFRLKRHAEALQDLNASVSLDPTRSSVYLARSTVLKQLKREEEALIDLRKSCEMKDVIGCYVLSQETNGGITKQ